MPNRPYPGLNIYDIIKYICSVYIYDRRRRVSGLPREPVVAVNPLVASSVSFLVGCGDQCGVLHGLQVLYVIPRSGVPRHMIGYAGFRG